MVARFRAWVRDCWTAWGIGAVLAILVMFVAGPALVPHLVPMSRYYELRSVTIANTTVGVSPHILVDRTIHENFRGRFEIEIMRAEGSTFSAWWVCGPHSSNYRTYRSEAAIPADATLDWWLEIPPNRACTFPPGAYKIVTTVYAVGPLGAELSTTTESNVFEVTG